MAEPKFCITKTFGEKLLDGEKEIDTEEALSGKSLIGIYFSAHWCPPCRGFTPKLAAWYDANKKTYDLEIVFVSHDRGEAEFKEYFNTMPWKAVKFSDLEKYKPNLVKDHGVTGIPKLVFLDRDTGDYTKKFDGKDGRGFVEAQVKTMKS